MFNLVLLALMPAAFALNPVVGRALAGVLAPGQLTALRWCLAGLLVVAVALWRGRRERWSAQPAGWPMVLALGALGMGFCSYSAYAAATTTVATNISLIYACTGALVVLYECASRQVRPTVPLLAGVILCLAGAATIITKGRLHLIADIGLTIGDLWAVAGTIGWAIYTLAMKRMKTGLTPLAIFAVMSLAGSVAFLPVAAAETTLIDFPSIGAYAAAWIAAMVFIASIGSYLSYNLAIRHAGPILTSAALSLNSLYTALFAMVLVGEQLAWFHAAGGALVVAGLSLINFDKARGAG
jgi:drug/metabolite transporter (DMT)-like permease